MTPVAFAMATGFNTEYIRVACRTGKIPCEVWGGQYDIPSTLVPVWKAKKQKRNLAQGKTVYNSSYLYQCELDKYNAEHGTDLSYGMAVVKGVIIDEQKTEKGMAERGVETGSRN